MVWPRGSGGGHESGFACGFAHGLDVEFEQKKEVSNYSKEFSLQEQKYHLLR